MLPCRATNTSKQGRRTPESIVTPLVPLTPSSQSHQNVCQSARKSRSPSLGYQAIPVELPAMRPAAGGEERSQQSMVPRPAAGSRTNSKTLLPATPTAAPRNCGVATTCVLSPEYRTVSTKLIRGTDTKRNRPRWLAAGGESTLGPPDTSLRGRLIPGFLRPAVAR